MSRRAVEALGDTVASLPPKDATLEKMPAFQNALGKASRRAVFLYPTKALAQDQLGKIKGFGLRGVHPGTYDGDTPHALRADIRRKANILLTNPDMLNIGILPNHEAWA